MRHARPFAALAVLAALAASPAAACTVSTTPVAFGTYNSTSPAPTDGVGSVRALCHPNVQSITIAVSSGGAGSFATRRMASGANRLNYNLFTTAARITVLGDGTGGSSTMTANTGLVSAGTRTYDVPLYGRIPAAQQVPFGAYSDNLFVTIIF